MKVVVFGNRDLDLDSLPLRILGKLEKIFPQTDFEIKDPSEELETMPELMVIDTVLGIDKARLFSDLKDFTDAPRFSLHDFDMLAELKYLRKLGKIKKIKIIGLPPAISEKEAVEAVTKHLSSQLSENARRSSSRDRKP